MDLLDNLRDTTLWAIRWHLLVITAATVLVIAVDAWLTPPAGGDTE